MENRIDNTTARNIEEILMSALKDGRNQLFEHEAYGVLELIGICSPDTIFIKNLDEIDNPGLSIFSNSKVVCKLISPGMLHRSEYGGIQFVKPTVKNLSDTFLKFSGIAKGAEVEFSGMMVARYHKIDDNIPNQLLVSLRQDKSFGPVVTMGLGGLGTEIYKEALKDRKGLFLCSSSTTADNADITKLLEETMFYPVITGKTRISEKALLQEMNIQDIITTFISLAGKFSPLSDFSPVTIEELEVNPLQISGGKVIALDAFLKISTNKISPRERSPGLVKTLLNPESILLIGASAGRTNMGRIVLSNLSKSKTIPNEKIFLLHPDPDINDIEGFKTYNTLDEIDEKIDLVVFTIPASEKSTGLIEEIINGEKANSLIIISGGFNETKNGKEYSKRIERSLEKMWESSSEPPVINGPNCMGISSAPGGYNTFFIPDYKLSFDGDFGKNSAFISQSGAFLVSMMSILTEINPSYMITVGNQLDLTITDYLLTLGDDPALNTFFLYIEGFKPFDGKRFLEAAGRIIESGKKIVVYKSGRSAEGAAAVASHTAAMAGDYFIFRRLMTDTGILVADSLADFEDYMKIFSFLSGKIARGNRVGIISDAGYECSSASDNLGGLKLSNFSKETILKLKNNLPSRIVDTKNPVDTTPAVDTARYGKCAESIIDDPDTDCVIISNVAATFTQENLAKGTGHNEDIRNTNSHPNTIIRLVNGTKKPVVVSLNGGKIYDPAAKMMEKSGVCVFRNIGRAIKALDKFLEHS